MCPMNNNSKRIHNNPGSVYRLTSVVRQTVFFVIVILIGACSPKSMAQPGVNQAHPDFKVIATGLRFPEGPIAMPDGSIILVEMERGTLSHVSPDGTVSVIAKLGGGPNGAAMGPDEAIYVCNNGGLQWIEMDSLLIPGETAPDYSGGSIQHVELHTGKVETLYTTCDGRNLSGPNDIVFDTSGGMWFTDQGKYYETYQDHGAVYYAKLDGSFISRQLEKLETPNGIRLSPDGSKIYYSETITGRIWSFSIQEPGLLDLNSKKLVIGLPGYQLFDSFALEANGNICAATLINGGISVISPEGTLLLHIPTNDILTTSICFGGKERKTAFITLGGTGKLVAIQWDNPGLPLNFLSY